MFLMVKSLACQVEGQETKTEYRVWNPFRSKLAAAILGGVDKIHIKPGVKVLYLGAASGTTVSHVSDIVGPVSDCSAVLLGLDVFCCTLQIFFLVWSICRDTGTSSEFCN